MSTTLLNDDGTASMATLLMCSHHAFRRDIACFAKALATGDLTRVDAMREEWTRFREALHGHHTVEDTAIFPSLRTQDGELTAALDELDAHHRAIDPLLVRGDRAFADLPHQATAALDVIRTLGDLLVTHLDREEGVITPHLRGAKEFPPLANDQMVALYADGFAWSSAGISSTVLDHVFAMLPPVLVEKIPAARRAFDERCLKAWGYVHTGQSLTSAA